MPAPRQRWTRRITLRASISARAVLCPLSGGIVSRYKYEVSQFGPTTLSFDAAAANLYSVGVESDEIGLYTFDGTGFEKVAMLDSCLPVNNATVNCLDPNINILFDTAGLLYVAYSPTGIGAGATWQLATFQLSGATPSITHSIGEQERSRHD